MAGPAYFDAFRRIVVQPDNITISADAVDDTLTLVAGAGISLVANAGSDQITIVNTNTSSPTNDLFARRLTVDGIVIDTNVITGTDSNADLELDANGTGAVSVIGNLKVSGVLASSSTKIAIGSSAGNTNQGSIAVAIGDSAGETDQGSAGVAIGYYAGKTSQETGAVAIGYTTAQITQRTGAVAIGWSAGQTNQGANAIAIGYRAGFTNQNASSIVLNASGVALEAPGAGLFVNPVRSIANGKPLMYDTATSELAYSSALEFNGTTISTADSSAIKFDGPVTFQTAVTVDDNLTVGGNLNVSGNISINNSGGIGYTTGVGGTVTQTSNRGNGVTLNKITGEITLVSASIPIGGINAFLCNNNLIESTDVVYAQVSSYNPGVYLVVPQAVTSPAPGIFFYLRNIDSFASPTEVVTIRYIILKSTNS